MRKTLFGLLLILIALSAVSAVMLLRVTRPAQEPPTPTFPPPGDYETLSIQELRQRTPASGAFNLEGYVARMFNCPSCPTGAVCMPCMEEHIVVSDQAQPLEAGELSGMEVMIIVQNPHDYFSLGEKYRFSVQILESRTMEDSFNDLELIGFEP